jgi:rfaE bifunctional protein kinase chain/domain
VIETTLAVVQRFLARAASVRVLVAGDCMLDAYVSGSASRISPEAPVPVVNVSHRRYVPGGAANVAANVRAMGVSVTLAGVAGADDSATQLFRKLADYGIDAAALVIDTSRPTTTKTRITAGQQIVRFDEEDLSPLSPETAAELRAHTEASLESATVCIVSDYAKGAVDDAFSRWFIGEARRRGLPVVVDPKALDFSRYRGATVITPNLRETAAAAREPVYLPLDASHAARLLLPQIAPSALLVTRGEEGMSLFEPGQPERYLAAVVKEVADVTGAGDTVVAALAIALGAGFALAEAAAIANIAAGVAVSHHGTWAVMADELLAAAALSVSNSG